MSGLLSAEMLKATVLLESFPNLVRALFLTLLDPEKL